MLSSFAILIPFCRSPKCWKELLLSSLFLNITLLAFPLGVQIIFDRVVHYHATATLVLIAAAMMMILLLDSAMRIARGYLINYFASCIEVSINNTLFKHLLALPYQYYLQHSPGNIIHDFLEIEQIRFFILKRLPEMILSASSLIFFIPVIFYYQGQLASILLLISFVCGCYVFKKMRPMQLLIDKMYAEESNKKQYITETIRQMKVIKYLRIETERWQKWQAMLQHSAAIHQATENQMLWSQTIIKSLEKTMSLCVICFGAYQVMQDKLSMGSLIAMQLVCSSYLSAGVIRMAELLNEMSRLKISLHKLKQFLAHTAVSIEDNQSSFLFQGNIEFKDVAFSYPLTAHFQLNKLNFAINKGEHVLIVGKSGIGKSTLINLLTGIMQPSLGSILFDGKSLANSELDSIRQQINIVPQDNLLFRGSIKDNISLKQPNADMDIIVKAAKIAAIHDVILALPEGYDTAVESLRDNLSAGQKQRIAIARAFVASANCYIFDEATSALDKETEQIIWQNIRQQCHQATLIIISHTTDVCRRPDKILQINHDTISVILPEDE